MKTEINKDRQFLIDRLGYFRNKANMSARELSNRMGHSDGYIAKFEMGGINMPTEVLLDALKVLNVSPEEFFCKKPETFNETKELIEKYNQLSSQKRHFVKKLLSILK